MSNNLRWKILVILVVGFVCGSIGVYPIAANFYGIHAPSWLIDKQLKLGLDLQGGVQFVLRVETDAALRLETDNEIDRLREALTKNGIAARISPLGISQFRVEGVPTSQAVLFRQATAGVEGGFERSTEAAGTYTFTMKPSVQIQRRTDAVTGDRETIERRVNELGVTEPMITQQGPNNDQLLVQLPGITSDRAKDIIQASGLLELKLVEQGPAPTEEALVFQQRSLVDLEVVPEMTGTGSTASPAFFLVRKTAIVSGIDLRTARPSFDENNQPAVTFTLTNEGGRKFAKATGDNIGRQLAVVLDGRVRSVARIETRITTDGRIAGGLSQAEAQDLSLILRSGALPAPLSYLAEETIGPTLGADSVRLGVRASIAGLLLVVGFMLIYYRRSGVNAVVALLFNLIMLLGMMASIGAVMTLPGIAGFVLTMGIGVDSNVLIFERIKEELEAKAGVRAAINAGFSRVFRTLLDTHIAALIAAACLFQFGTGPVRGFAMTLSIGLLSNLFTSTFVSKTLFELALNWRREAGPLSI